MCRESVVTRLHVIVLVSSTSNINKRPRGKRVYNLFSLAGKFKTWDEDPTKIVKLFLRFKNVGSKKNNKGWKGNNLEKSTLKKAYGARK